MFSLFRSDPTKQLKKQHTQKLEQAFIAQRNGNIRGYSELTQEAEDIASKIREIESRLEEGK